MLFAKEDRYYSADRPTENHVRNLEGGERCLDGLRHAAWSDVLPRSNFKPANYF